MLGRKVLGPVEVVLPIDPAIVPDCDYTEYEKSHFDQSKLTFKEGEEPTVWTLRPLSTDEMDWCLAHEKHFYLRAIVRCGLVGIKNYHHEDQNGAVTLIHTPKFVQSAETGSKIISEDWLKTMNFSMFIISELSEAITKVSNADPLS